MADTIIIETPVATVLEVSGKQGPQGIPGQKGDKGDPGEATSSLPWTSITGKPSTFAPSAHTHPISEVTGLQTALDGKQASGNYATLVGGTVPSAQLPSYVDDVIEVSALPSTGETGKIYITTNNKVYRWSGSAFIEIVASPGSTDSVPEGTTNLYHTTARAAAAAPVQSVNGQTGAVTVSAPSASNATPQALGTASAGSSANFARADHVHAMPTAADVGAASASHTHVSADITDLQTNGNAAGLWDSVNDEQLVSTGDGELQIRKTGTALSGAFNAGQITVDRGYNLPDASGTLALTTTVVDNATGLWDSANSVTGAVVLDYELSVTDGANTSNLTFPVGASRNYTFPNATGTVALTSDITKSAVGLSNVTNNAQVTSVTGTAPIVSSGGTTPAISISAATTLSAGSMSAADKTKLDGIAANANNYVHPNHTGDVTSSGDGATIIANNAVTNAKLAQVATSTIKGRATAATGNVEDLTATQVRTIINVADGATANSSDATLLNRANHTGTQAASTITGLGTLATANAATPPNLGTTTPAQGFFTNLSASAELTVPAVTPASPSAGDIYRNANTLRYRDSTNTERLLLNATDNLANLGSASTARTNLGVGSSDAVTFGSIQNTPIGSTTASSGAFTTLSANNGTLTASAPVLDLSQTWNASGTTFTALRLNVTNTASNSASNLLDIQVGGTTRMMLKRDGVLHLGQFTNSGFYSPAPVWHGSTAGLLAATNLAIGSSLDTILERGGAGILEQRNLANAQTFRLYNTFTDASNYERAKIAWSSNVLQIGTEKAGTGSARALEFQTDGTTRITISAAGDLSVGGFSTFNNNVSITSGRVLTANQINLNNTSTALLALGTDSTIRWGSSSATTPMLKRSSTALQVRLADDTAYTTIDAQLRAQGTAPASATATGTAGDIRYDGSYFYVCTASNTWVRAALATW